MLINLHDTCTNAHASRAHSFTTLLTVLGALASTACWPPPMPGDEFGSATETSFGSETAGDGDGDPAGDGDGDACNDMPVVTCEQPGDCWAASPSWTAEARATMGDGPGLIVPGIWVPVNLGIDAECWELDGVGTHVCLVDVCGERLLGTPAVEMILEPDPSCDFAGAWESTAGVFGTCFGLINGVAVELRSHAPTAGELWGPCPVSEQGTVDLCNSEDLACVPADGGAANICLPLGECPDVVPLGIFGEIGWGDACYPRCGQDSECMAGQVCAMAVADGGSVCAWPLNIGWCCTSLAPDEVCFAAEAIGQCEDGIWCPSDAIGNPACP